MLVVFTIRLKMKETIINYFKSLQDDICQSLEIADGEGKF